MICRGPFAPYACPAGQAFGMRHGHAWFGALATPARRFGARPRRSASSCLRARTSCTRVALSRRDLRWPARGWGAQARPHLQQRWVWPAIGAWQPWHRRGSWRLRMLLVSSCRGGGSRVSSPRGFVDGVDATGSMRSPFQASAGQTGSEASDWCAFASVTLADTGVCSAPSARIGGAGCEPFLSRHRGARTAAGRAGARAAGGAVAFASAFSDGIRRPASSETVDRFAGRGGDRPAIARLARLDAVDRYAAHRRAAAPQLGTRGGHPVRADAGPARDQAGVVGVARGAGMYGLEQAGQRSVAECGWVRATRPDPLARRLRYSGGILADAIRVAGGGAAAGRCRVLWRAQGHSGDSTIRRKADAAVYGACSGGVWSRQGSPHTRRATP